MAVAEWTEAELLYLLESANVDQYNFYNELFVKPRHIYNILYYNYTYKSVLGTQYPVTIYSIYISLFC